MSRKPGKRSPAKAPALRPTTNDLDVAAMVGAFYDAARARDADGVDMLRAAMIVVMGVTYDTGGNINALCRLLRDYWPRLVAGERAAADGTKKAPPARPKADRGRGGAES